MSGKSDIISFYKSEQKQLGVQNKIKGSSPKRKLEGCNFHIIRRLIRKFIPTEHIGIGISYIYLIANIKDTFYVVRNITVLAITFSVQL